MQVPDKLALAVLKAIWQHHSPAHVPYGLPPRA